MEDPMEKNTTLSGKTLRKSALMVTLLAATLSLTACVIPHDRGHRDGGRRHHHQWNNNDDNWNGGGHHRRPHWQGQGGSGGGGSWGGGGHWNGNH
jgi:hypothetical protein